MHLRTVPPLRSHAWRGIARVCIAICWLVSLGWSTQARADTEPVLGHTESALTGLDQTLAPTSPVGTVVSANVHYGLTESVGPYAGVHQRIGADVALAYSPTRWFSVAAETKGRIDLHPRDDRGADHTGTGDPYLFLRAGGPVHRRTSLGASLSTWIPGSNAPSLVLRASTFELRVLQETRFPKRGVRLVSNLGFRLDESAHSAPPLARLRYGDRVALGLSDFHGVPWGVGVLHHRRPTHALFVELSGLLLLTTQSGVLRASPLRISAGTRHFLRKGLEVEGGVRVSLSEKPRFSSDAPLVPFEPRALVHVALRWDGARHDAEKREQLVPIREEEYVAPPTEQSPPPRVRVLGSVLDERGEALPDCAIALRLGDEVYESVSAFDGSFEVGPLPTTGEASLSIRARGYLPQTLPLTIAQGALQLPSTRMERSSSQGVLRMVVRSFKSEPVAADVIVKNARGRDVTRARSDRDGHFEATLPPGTYRVTTSAKGFEAHVLSVRVSADEVAIINVDLRGARAR